MQKIHIHKDKLGKGEKGVPVAGLGPSIFDFSDLVEFVMCTLISRECVPFCKYIKRHVYPGNQGTHDRLNQIQRLKVEMFEK